MSCTACYELNLKACQNTFVLDAGLEPTTAYYWVLRHKIHDKLYQKLEATDADGKLTIDFSALPEGSTNPHAGPYELTIRNGADYLDFEELEFEEKVYDCALVIFQDVELLEEPD